MNNLNSFSNPLEVEQVPDSNRWIVVREVRYLDPYGNVIVVPAGFETDFASVPALARVFSAIAAVTCAIVPFCWWCSIFVWASLTVCFLAEWLENSGTDQIAVVHDWLYHTRRYPRYKADWILFKGMIATGASRNSTWKRCLFWINVRLFGWIPWINDHANASRKN